MNEDLSLIDFIQIIKKRAILIILFCISGLLVFSFLTFSVLTPQFKSTSQLLVTHSTTDASASYLEINDNSISVNTYKEIIKGPVILEDVQRILSINTPVEYLSNQVEVLNQDDSQIFSIVVTDENPQQAALIANTIAEVFEKKLWDIMNIDNVTIISRANPNAVPVSLNVYRNLATGTIFGLMLGVLVAFLIDWLDDTIKNEESIANELGWSTLGEIIEYREKSGNKNVENEMSDEQQQTMSFRTRV